MKPIVSTPCYLIRPTIGLMLLAFAGVARAQSASAEVAPAVSVSTLVSEITSKNPEVAFYEAELDAAKAGRKAAGTRENPELSLELGRKRVTDSTGALAGEGTAWSVSVSQTFEWPGRLALRKAIANQDIALAELGLARFKAALASRARTLTLRWIPKVGQVGSLIQNQRNDPHVQETTSAQS